jgi:hypothetical protein
MLIKSFVYWSLLIAIVLGGHNILLCHENDPQSQLERENELIIVGGDSLMAVIPPSYWKPRSYGMIIGAEYYNEISKYDWDISLAYSIMVLESSGNAYAKNNKDYHYTGKCWGSYGLFQLACFRGNLETLYDPKENIRLAYELWKVEGWKPWGVCGDKINCQ